MVDSKELNIPTHVGIIMDGNGRWAQKRMLPRSAGHSAGMNRMIALVKKAEKMGVKYFTAYALSTENLSRPREELEKIYSLIKDYFTVNVKKLLASGKAVKVIGNLSLLPPDVSAIIEREVAASPEGAPFTFVIALGYGAREEMVHAVNAAVRLQKEVDEKSFASRLYTGGIPDPDFIIRTGGELRLSNFLLWQAAYTELYFTDVLFPDFSERKFEKAIEEYSRRVRRFGKI